MMGYQLNYGESTVNGGLYASLPNPSRIYPDSAIGSIYQQLDSGEFYVGPLGPSVRTTSPNVDRGPWTSTRDWLKACLVSELAAISKGIPRDIESTECDWSLTIVIHPIRHLLSMCRG